MASTRPGAMRDRNDEARFEVYRADTVSITSTLFAGGDWHWRLTSLAGAVLVDCGGYRTQIDAVGAVDHLRAHAGSAQRPKVS